MVLDVCRAVLGNEADAEDAFQATFLILARKAHTIHQHQSLSSWLYKVAYRVALRARANIARRRSQEQQAIQKPPDATPGEVMQRELGKVVDEEVQRLPEKYRTPVLLCYLQGQTNEEAAEQLRCPTGTVKIRLLRARELLRKRLARRGLGMSMIALTAGLLENAACAAVPAPLAGGTLSAMAGGEVSAGVAALMSSTLKAMCVAKLKAAAALLLTVLLGWMADGMSQRAYAEPVPDKVRQLEPAPPTYSEPPPMLLAQRD